MKICVNYIAMNIGTPENKGVINKTYCVQFAAFTWFSCGKPVMWSHVRTESKRKLNAEIHSVFEAFSAFGDVKFRFTQTNEWGKRYFPKIQLSTAINFPKWVKKTNE